MCFGDDSNFNGLRQGTGSGDEPCVFLFDVGTDDDVVLDDFGTFFQALSGAWRRSHVLARNTTNPDTLTNP